MKRIQVHKKPGEIGTSLFLNVLHDRDRRNTSFLGSFPHLWKIIAGGFGFASVCFAVFYIADPSLAKQWSSTALSMLPFNRTDSGSGSSVLDFASFFANSPWASNATNTATGAHVQQIVSIREGFHEGLVEHPEQFQFIWQAPLVLPKAEGRGGIVFIAPACKRPATEWFPPSANCTTCQGLPIQLRIVDALRMRGFAVVAMAPVESKGKCWHQNDRKQVGMALKYVREAMATHFSISVPIYGIGVENGGVFLGNFAESLGLTYQARISAVCLMNSGIWHMNMKPGHYPAVAFLDLARNGELCEHNNATVHKLRERGIPATQFYSDPRPITKDYFVPLMSAEQSEAYRDALVQAGYVWPASHVLLKDPTSERYRYDMVEILARIAPAATKGESAAQPHTALMQLLRLAWGYKEVNDDHIDKIIDWFEAHSPAAAAGSTAPGSAIKLD